MCIPFWLSLLCVSLGWRSRGDGGERKVLGVEWSGNGVQSCQAGSASRKSSS